MRLLMTMIVLCFSIPATAEFMPSSMSGYQLSCDGLEGNVKYNGRKTYFGNHTLHYLYQSVETGEIFKVKTKPHCVIVGITPEALEQLKAEQKIKEDEFNRNQNTIIYCLLLVMSVLLLLSFAWRG